MSPPKFVRLSDFQFAVPGAPAREAALAAVTPAGVAARVARRGGRR